MSEKTIFNLKNISIYSLVMDLIHRAWIIVIVVCLGIMGEYTFLKKDYVPQYTSSAIYVVTPRQSTNYVFTNRRFAESVISVFQNLMNTEIMNTRIKQELHKSDLGATMLVDLIEGTNLMKITVTSDDPIEAFKTIGIIMENYNELSEYLNSDAVFDELKAPVVATMPSNSLMPQNKSVMMGLVAGLIAVILIVLFSIFRKTIKSESVIEEELDTNLLGTILHEKKNKTLKAKIAHQVRALLITSPIISTQFVEAVNNIRIRMEYEHERHPNRNVYMLSSVCENEGKSTVALNVALSFAREGKKVILIDADMRKPAIYKMLDIPKSEVVDLVNLFEGRCGLDEVMYNDHRTGLHLILSSKGHSSTHAYMKSGAMLDLISKCRMMADYVIIDTPPMALVSDAEALLDRVDYSVLVVRQDFSYQKDVQNSINLMNDSNSKMLGCVLNDYRIFHMNMKKQMRLLSNTEGKAVEIYED